MDARKLLGVLLSRIKSAATAAVPEAVSDWLEENVDPDTGYVIDNTLSVSGAAADAKKVGDEISDLKSAISRCAKEKSTSMASYFYKANTYINSSYAEASSGSVTTNLYKIPKQGSSIIALSSSVNEFYSPMTLANSLHLYKSTGAISTGTAFYRKETGILLVLIPSECDGIFINCAPDNASGVSVSFSRNDDTLSCYAAVADTAITSVEGLIKTNSYKASSAWSNISSPYFSYWMEAKQGDMVQFSEGGALVYNGCFVAENGTGQTISANATFTAPSNGWISIIQSSSTLLPKFIYTPVDSIKINAIYVVGEPYRRYFSAKKWTSFGDSITYYGLWQKRIIEQTAIQHSNCGIGGTYLAGDHENAFWTDDRLNAVKATNPDIVTILGGANDCFGNTPIGTDSDIESKTTSTFLGAYSYIIDNLLTWKPALKIVILTTTYAHNNGAAYTYTYDQYADACKTIAEYYHLPCVDLYGESGFNAYTMGNDDNAIYSEDNIHPNQAGANIIASMVLQKFMEVFLMT